MQSGAKMTLFFSLLLLARIPPAKSFMTECYDICSYGMSDACCSCIGCDQSMRFGKRSDGGRSFRKARWLLRGGPAGYNGKRSSLDVNPSNGQIAEDSAANPGAEAWLQLYVLERMLELERLRRRQHNEISYLAGK